MTESNKYEKFLHINNIPYAFIEVPASFLAEELPTNADWSTKDNGSQKTIEEYCSPISKSLDESKAIIGLCATVEPTYRVLSLTYDDLQDWETWLDTKSYTIDKWLTVSEVRTLLASSDYEQE